MILLRPVEVDLRIPKASVTAAVDAAGRVDVRPFGWQPLFVSQFEHLDDHPLEKRLRLFGWTTGGVRGSYGDSGATLWGTHGDWVEQEPTDALFRAIGPFVASGSRVICARVDDSDALVAWTFDGKRASLREQVSRECSYRVG